MRLINNIRLKLENLFNIIPGYFNVKQEILDLLDELEKILKEKNYELE